MNRTDALPHLINCDILICRNALKLTRSRKMIQEIFDFADAES